MRTLIIGLGTGRCGTKSFANLFNIQEDSTVVHEGNPEGAGYPKDMKLFEEKFDNVIANDTQFVGDVSFYNIYYIEEIVDRFTDRNCLYPYEEMLNIKFVVAKRNKEQVVASYLKHSSNRSWWDKPNNDYWSRFYPEFQGTQAEKIGKYWDWYYEEIYKYIDKYDMKVFDITELNTEEGVNKILDFVGYTDKNVSVKVHMNKNLTSI